MHIFDPKTLAESIGYAGLVGIIFAECGLFFGFFFPGDSLLFAAGVLASQGYLSITPLALLLPLASIGGNIVGYHFGRVAGPRVFRRADSIFFHKNHILRAERFFETYGSKSIVLGRFMPVIRTFVPIVAGIGSMPYRTFLIANVVGGAAWVWLLLGLGYGLGTSVPDIDRFLLPIAGVIIIVSFVPPAISLWKERRRGKIGE